MIRVEGLSLTIKNVTILSDINFSVRQGEIAGLVGRNGCGKTMLMKCITGFVKATKGKVFFDENVIGEDVDFPKSTGIIIEAPGFVPYYSGMKKFDGACSTSRENREKRSGRGVKESRII